MAATDELDHRTMDNLQEAASLSDTSEQILLEQDAVATMTSTMKDLPTLLNVPLEIRRLIYRYFLKFHRDDHNDTNGEPAKLEITLLHVSRQLRSEALEYLAGNNMWTKLSIASSKQLDLHHELLNAPYFPLDLLPKQEMEILLSETALTIELSKPSQTSNTHKKRRTKLDIIFGYTTISYVVLCELLVTMRKTQKAVLSITVAPKFLNRNHSIIEDLILPYMIARTSTSVPDIQITGVPNLQLANALIRGVNKANSCARDYQNHLLALKEEGNKFFVNGCFAAAMLYYHAGVEFYEPFVVSPTPPVQMTGAEINVLRSIFVDVCNNLVHICNSMVAALRNTAGVLPMHSIAMILDVIASSQRVFAWCGMSNQQRQKAHYRHAVAFNNFADYCSDPRYVEYMHTYHAEDPMTRNGDPEYLYRIAARQYYSSWKADVHSRSAPYLKGLYRKMQKEHNCFVSEDPDLITIHGIPGYGNGVWEGDYPMIGRRLPDEMRLALQQSVPREDKTMTKEELERMKQDLGMPGDHIDGLIRLLRPEEAGDVIDEHNHEAQEA